LKKVESGLEGKKKEVEEVKKANRDNVESVFRAREIGEMDRRTVENFFRDLDNRPKLQLQYEYFSFDILGIMRAMLKLSLTKNICPKLIRY
jgi:hypothetical protein